MAGASSINEDLKKGLCRKLSTLKALVSPILDDLIIDLIEKEALTWEERHEIRAFPGQYRQADRLIEIIIDNNRMLPFVEVLRRFHSDFVDTIYKEENIIGQRKDQSISRRLELLESAHRERRAREDNFFNKVEEIMSAGVNKMANTFQQTVSHISATSDKKIEEKFDNFESTSIQKLNETLENIQKNMKAFKGTFQELIQDMKQVMVNENPDSELEKKVSEKYDKIKKEYDDINQENDRILSLQKILRQRIIDLEKRLTTLHKENITLKSECTESNEKIKQSSTTLHEKEMEIKELKETIKCKEGFISFIENEFESIKKENARLREDMANLRKSKRLHARDTLKKDLQVEGKNTCETRRN